MWRKLFLFSGYMFAIILVLAAILICVARGYPSLYQHYLPRIQDNISTIIGKPVRADAIRIDWRGYTPLISVDDLSIYADDTKQDRLLFAKKARLSIDIYKSLIQKNISINQLTLVGCNLEAIRTAEQKVILNGMDISERIAQRKKLNTKNKVRISLLESTITIKDEIKKLDYFFDRVDIALGFDGDRFKVTANIVLPETLGDSFLLMADLKDLDQGLHNVKGSLYTKGKNINLELLSDFFPQLQVGIKAGNSDFEVWGNLRSSLQRSFKGSLEFRDLEYNNVAQPIKGVVSGQEVTALKAQFEIEGDKDRWQLALFNSDIQTADAKWPRDRYEVACMGCGGPDYFITAALGYVDITALSSSLQHFPIISEPLLESLFSKAQIQGVLQNTSATMQWHEKQLEKYSYKISLQTAAVSIPSQGFEISSVAGVVQGNHFEGSIKIDAAGMNAHIEKISDYSFQDHKVVGTIKWKRMGENLIVALENISLTADGISANMQGSIQMVNGKAYVDLQGEVPLAQAEKIVTYLPYNKMRPKLRRWLKASIHGGTIRDGKILFQGNPKHFPFKDKPGAFEVVASVENGVLDYRKDWPSAREVYADFLIKNKYLIVNGHQGSILNSSISQVTATIDDLKLPRLVLNGVAVGPAGDILDFLKKSSLIPANSKITKHISADGNTKLDLNLALTLTKKLEKEISVKGVIEFDNTNLTITSVSLPFTNLNGKLNFNRQGAAGTGLSAKLFGLPFNANVYSSENGRTELFVTGDIDLSAYLASSYEELNQYIKGVTSVTATVSLPRFGKHAGEKSLGINIDSSLLGALVSLPQPFGKEFDEQKKLSVHTRYQTGKGYPLFVTYDDRVFMQASWSDDGDVVSAVEVRVGDDQFDLPAQGLKLSGRLEELDVTAWLDIVRSSKSNNKNSAIQLSEIDIKARSVSVTNLEMQDVDFQLIKGSQYWLGEINSSIAKGKFNYPLHVTSETIATGDFDYLRFNKPEKKTMSTFDPRNLPALEINTHQFSYDKYIFKDVSLITETSATGMLIKSLTGNGEALNISANGAWEVGANDKQRTNIDVVLVSQNLHSTLTGLGFKAGVSKGQGSVAAKLNWPNAPYQFSADAFSGTANLRLKDGEMLSVEPGGAGRLVGLFNLGEITRRLSLDFTDFFSKGYVFDKIRGDLVFENANLTTENLFIKGPSAHILIQGRTGIVAKDYDQVVTVTPHVSGGLPWIGLAVGGPLGAVGVIVGEKVAKTIGIDINKVTEIKYSMTGSWDDPKIERVAQKVVKTSTSAQGQPSPQLSPSN